MLTNLLCCHPPRHVAPPHHHHQNTSPQNPPLDSDLRGHAAPGGHHRRWPHRHCRPGCRLAGHRLQARSRALPPSLPPTHQHKCMCFKKHKCMHTAMHTHIGGRDGRPIVHTRARPPPLPPAQLHAHQVWPGLHLRLPDGVGRDPCAALAPHVRHQRSVGCAAPSAWSGALRPGGWCLGLDP